MNYTEFYNERSLVLAEIGEALKLPQRTEVLRRVARMLRGEGIANRRFPK